MKLSMRKSKKSFLSHVVEKMHMLTEDISRSETVSADTNIPPPDWEALIAQIADDVVAEHTPARILEVRAKLYDLLTHCIPATTILKVSVQTSFQCC